MSNSKCRVSVVIPVYNEKDGLKPVLEGLRKTLAKVSHEIIVVDDGSQDQTSLAVAGNKGITLLRHPYNKGYGAALKTGIRASRGEWILIIDGDNTYPVRAIPRMLEMTKEYDMVVAGRTQEKPPSLFLRNFAKFFLVKLAQFLTGRKIPDLNSGLRLFRKRASLPFFSILPSGFSFTTTITLAYLTHELTVGYLPVDYRERVGRSKIRPIRDTFNFILLIARTVMYFNPLKIFMAVSLVLMVLGLAEACFYLTVSHSISKSTVLLLLSSILVGMLGLLADLIIKRLPLLDEDKAGR